MIRVESNYNPLAVSNKGALGLMQLVPSTARRFGVADVFNPAQNVEGGVRYLKYLLDLYTGDNRLALAAYNAGEGDSGALRRCSAIRGDARLRLPRGKGTGRNPRGEQTGAMRNLPAKPAPEFNPIRAFVNAMGRIYYKTP